MRSVQALSLLVSASCVLAISLSGSSSLAATVGGGIVGLVVDQDTGKPLADVTVVAIGPEGESAALTDSAGLYELLDLPIGAYQVHFFHGNVSVEHVATVSVDQRVRVNARLASAPQPAITVAVTQRAAAIDVGSTRVGATLSQDFASNVPNSLRVSGLLEKVPGGFSDGAGLVLAGGTGAENVYYLDGLNITGIANGQLGTDLFVPFLEEAEVSSAGYGAEYGRALSGVVNMTTKSGTNQWRGSAFSYVTPGAFSGSSRRIFSRSTSLTGTPDPGLTTTLGAEVGGPIIKNRLFIWVGYAPEITRDHLTVHTDRFVEHLGADGSPDGQLATNPDGSPAVQPLATSSASDSTTTQHLASKLTWRLSPDHSLSIGTYSVLSNHEYLRNANADSTAGMTKTERSRHNLNLRWLSAFFERRWRLEASLGLHTEHDTWGPPDATSRQVANTTWNNAPSLVQFNPAWAAQCVDNPDTGFRACPVDGYQSGGFGTLETIDAFRIAGQVKSTNVFHGGGLHELKYGMDYELGQYRDQIAFSGPGGGHTALWSYPGETDTLTLFRLQPGETLGGIAAADRLGDLLAPPYYQDSLTSRTRIFNTGLFMQEGYSPLPNLTINAGLRWETQRMYDYRLNNAFSIHDALAPRIGVIYDPTKEGRAKVFAHFGRFFESIPMTITNRGLGGQGILMQAQCDPAATGCTPGLYPVTGETLKVQPNLKGSYNNEIVAGAQYQVLPDLVIGTTLIYRWLGRVVEDVADPSGNGPATLANPGDISQKTVDELERQAQAAEQAASLPDATQESKDAATAARALASSVQPKPERTYAAVQLTAVKRLGKNWLFSGSYVYSQLRGNYSGLYSADNDQGDPNMTTQYDFPGIMVNRKGPLPNDRPHVIRLDGSYTFNFARSSLTSGLGFVGRSGTPLNALGSFASPEDNDAFVLPRGAMGRTPFVTRFDLHIGYRVRLPANTSAEAFADIFNIFNQRTVLTQDQMFTRDFAQPIPAGGKADLAALAAIKNPNFLAPTSYQAPISGRLGLRVFF